MWTTDTLEWIDIELTSFCNIKCKGCFRVLSPYAEQINNKHYLDLSIIKERFQKEMFPNIRIINFCGSVDEPTSHPQFFEIIKHFSDWDAHINVATNGSLRTADWWKELASILPPKHKVTWGIDGSDSLSEVYREGSNFNKVEQNYRAFNSAGGKSNWQFIVFEHNEHQLEEAKERAKAEGFKDFKTIISHRKNTKDVKSAKQEIIEMREEEPHVSCKYANQKRIFVNHMGNVIPCCHLNAQMLEYPVSRVKRDRFEELLEEHNYEHDINLKNVSIEQALSSKVWQGIQQSWDSENVIPKCWKTCKKKYRDEFIKEKL